MVLLATHSHGIKMASVVSAIVLLLETEVPLGRKIILKIILTNRTQAFHFCLKGIPYCYLASIDGMNEINEDSNHSETLP